MTKDQLESAKQKMKDYRDIFGGELIRKDLIDDVKNVFDIDYIFEKQRDFIDDVASDAHSSLERLKEKLW